MSDLIAIPPQPHDEESDLEALQLFERLGAELCSSPQAEQHLLEEADVAEEEEPRLSRLSKMRKEDQAGGKKLSKKEMKKKKIKQKRKMKKYRNEHSSPAPRKKLKRQSSTKKKSNQSEAGQQFSDDRGSSEFDSASEDLDIELRNLNPDTPQQGFPKKRLKKSGRKEKIQEREGFKLGQLGNDPEFDISVHSESDEEYSLRGKKRNQKKKVKVSVLTNEQIMNAFKEHGVVESEGEDEEGGKNYDRGIEMLHSIKKKSKDTIRINNRLFGDLQMSLQNEEAQVTVPQDFELELKPKTSSSFSQRLSFLSKAENIKKMRGLDAEINMDEFARKADEKAKKSVAKIISSMTNQEFHDDIDLQIRVPTVARGKSADIINNTFFIRKTFDKHESAEPEEVTPLVLKPTKSLYLTNTRKQALSRQELFKQIQEQTRLKRSKYISNEELKNSFKKTDLEELEEARKKIQQKRRKEALSQEDSEEQELDSEIKEMIEKEEKVCGDAHLGDEDAQDEDYKPSHNSEGEEQDIQQPAQVPLEPEEKPEILPGVNDELQQYNQILQDLDNPSHISQELEDGAEASKEEQQSNEAIEMSQLEKDDEAEENMEVLSQPVEMTERDVANQKELQELEEEGIIVRKRRKNHPEALEAQQVQQQNERNQLSEALNTPNIQQENPSHNYYHQGHLNDTQGNQQLNHFRKLRKIAQVIARKKKEREMGRQYAAQFIEHEAEEGSDNEEHDDMVKNIDYEAEDKEYEGINLDADLVELIDNAVDINEEDQFEAFRKYLEDVRMQDRDQIKKIIRGEFWKKHEDLQFEMEEDERKRQERMEEVMNWMKQREEEEGEGIYLRDPPRQEEDSDEDSDGAPRRQQKGQEEQQQSEQLPAEEQMAKLTKFLEETMPTIKKEYKPVGNIKLFALPESVKRDSKNHVQKTISVSKFGSRTAIEVNPNKKSTSSLVNQILNKSMAKQRKIIPSIIPKNSSRK